MKVGKMDGFCVGEPWNARAIADGIGFTAITTQTDVEGSSGKSSERSLQSLPTRTRRPSKLSCSAVTESSLVHRQNGKSRPTWPRWYRSRKYINTQKEVILGRMLGDYDYGDGRKEKDPLYMTFFDRNT